MSWAEFNLRLIGFKQSEERDIHKRRMSAWASHMTPKKGQRLNSWWKIEDVDKPKVSEAHKQRFLNEYKKYLDKKEHGRA